MKVRRNRKRNVSADRHIRKTNGKNQWKIRKNRAVGTVQRSIPYRAMYKDGICKVTDTYYTKTIEFGDISYALAQKDDKVAIFEQWCDAYNYFDSSMHIQLSCVNRYADSVEMEKKMEIPLAGDAFDDIRNDY